MGGSSRCDCLERGHSFPIGRQRCECPGRAHRSVGSKKGFGGEAAQSSGPHSAATQRSRWVAHFCTVVMLNTPVILSVFNRPETTRRVFEAIELARPKQLFVFADGPRSAAEEVECAQVRAIVGNVSWACDANYHYSETNRGARECYTSGVDWAFSAVDEGIVLDDDCVPDPTFFRFSQDMLQRYRDDQRVMMVSAEPTIWATGRQARRVITFPISEACGAGPRGSVPGRSMTPGCRPGVTKPSRKGSANYSPTMRSTPTKLGGSIAFSGKPPIATRGISRGAWRDSSTQVSPSFPQRISSRTSATPKGEVCLRTIHWRI